MQISEEAIDRALEAFRRRYVEKAARAWDLDHHGRLWADARASVESEHDDAGFVKALNELRAHWQIARGKGAVMMDFGGVLPMLRKKASRAVAARLSSLGDGDISWLYQLINDVSDIKRVNGKPSLMAISKVLHFYNPRLFVIVDRAMVWDWTFAHGWIWDPIRAVRDEVDKKVGCSADDRDDTACDIASYVATLIWSGRLIRENPHLCERFESFLRCHTTSNAALPDDLATYEAAAAEWLLLGLVELPPPGVTV